MTSSSPQRPHRAPTLAILFGGLIAFGAWGTVPAPPSSGQEGTPTYPAGGRCASIDFRSAVVDQIRGYAMTTDDATLPTVVKVALERTAPPEGWRRLATYADTGPIFGLAVDGIRRGHHVATSPDDSCETPDAESLRTIYTAIADELRDCSAIPPWL